ncbi:MAG TPA: hypothetical protein VEU96_24400 [Bryobacteraceae bacterium]|nr:hypothetical protein [Bryobacteraceae bacterium]
MDLSEIWQGTFEAARRLASDPGARYVVLVRPNRTLLCIACPPAGSMPADQIEKMGQILPGDARRNVVVMASTEFVCGEDAEGAARSSSELIAAGKAIPFFGMLNGLAYIGHSVWVFDGQATAVSAGCKDADLLLIDSILASKLTTKTVADAAAVMRNANVLIHDRSSFGLKVLRKVGQSDHLEFH